MEGCGVGRVLRCQGHGFYQGGKNCSWCSIRRKQRLLRPTALGSESICLSTLSNDVSKLFSSLKPQSSGSLSVLVWKMKMIIAPLQDNSISHTVPQRLNDGLLQEGDRCDLLSTLHFLFHELRKKALRSGKTFFKMCSMRKSHSQTNKKELTNIHVVQFAYPMMPFLRNLHFIIEHCFTLFSEHTANLLVNFKKNSEETGVRSISVISNDFLQEDKLLTMTVGDKIHLLSREKAKHPTDPSVCRRGTGFH